MTLAYPFWLLRRALKRFVILVGFGDRLIEYCSRCGRHQPIVWWSTNELWSAVTGETPTVGGNMPGVFCPECFDALALKRCRVLVQWRAGVHDACKLPPQATGADAPIGVTAALVVPWTVAGGAA